MMKSLFSGVSGLKSHTTRMDVIGNNIANVNTTAYKASTVTFRDIYYQSKKTSSTGTATTGGVNPLKLGYGVAMGSIDKVMTQSGFTYSDSVYDCAIMGEGFFQVMDGAGNILYTRNGVFKVDNVGNLTDSNGYIVCGVSGDPTAADAGSQRINLHVPDVDNNQASATKIVNDTEVTFTASGYGPNGNVSVVITHSDSPFATMNGNVITVSMDLKQDFYATAAATLNITLPTTDAAEIQQINEQAVLEFEAAVNAAINAGGINPGDGVLPISITFSEVPADPTAKTAFNVMEFTFLDGGTPALSTKGYIGFEAYEAGATGNKIEVNMKAGSSTQTKVLASWSGSVLTITLPGEAAAADAVTLQDIQDAINKAAGMIEDTTNTATDWTGGWDPTSGTDSKKVILYTPALLTDRYDPANNAADFTDTLFDAITANAGTPPTDFTSANEILGTTTKRVGFKDGEDSFFKEISDSIGTMVMDNGRFEGPQTVSDLDLVFIDSGGVIYGEHPVHGRLMLGRIDIATFENPGGLDQVGTSYFKPSLASGDAQVKMPENDGAGEVVSGALEMANVDLSQEFSDMIITQRGFQANSRIITVSDTMLEELINLKR